MRVHIIVDDDVVQRIDQVAGERGRSGWIVKVVREALDTEERWAAIEAAIGSIPDTGHEWDEDPAAWVRAQRRADPRRVG
jgi:predicted transcriptional regulator